MIIATLYNLTTKTNSVAQVLQCSNYHLFKMPEDGSNINGAHPCLFLRKIDGECSDYMADEGFIKC